MKSRFIPDMGIPVRWNMSGKIIRSICIVFNRLAQAYIQTYIQAYRMVKLLSLWNNFQPVTIRIINKVDSHSWIFKANTIHLFVLF